MNKDSEWLVRKRMHGLYLSRKYNDDITSLSHELLGLHSWFYRNVPFSALVRGADISGWKTALTKTWLYRGTLHGIPYSDLPRLLSLNTGHTYLESIFSKEMIESFANEVMRYMEDGVYSRKEFRQIFAESYEPKLIDTMFSPWGGIFVHLSRKGKAAFRDMTSRDFDLISAEPTQSFDEVIPGLLQDFFRVYGPATIEDAMWFFGISLGSRKNSGKELQELCNGNFNTREIDKRLYYYCGDEETADIPKITLLSGFDPIVVSYVNREAILPAEYKSRVILKSGICNPSIAVDGQIAGIWNIKKNQSILEFFSPQPKNITTAAQEMVDLLRFQTQ